jgi:tetratricopeptide (TPR) repeat protein
MKKIVFLSLTVMVCSFGIAQPGKKTVPGPAPSKSNPHLNVFTQCIQSGDVATAINALNYYIYEQKGNTPYADTIAMLYMQQGAYAQCYYWANKRLELHPDDNGLMEMKAICLDKGQQPKEAIALYEKLFSKTKSPYHAYKLMELQYGIKRLAECLATAAAAERLEFKPEMIMSYSVGEQMGRTYLQAGIFNIHGLALYDLDKKPEAKTYFEKALVLDSNFVLARQNLEAMKVEAANGGKVKDNKPVQEAVPANKQN